MLKRKISLAVALPLVLSLVGIFFFLDDRAATAATEVKPTVWTREKCVTCHVNERTLKMMQDKAGDPTFCQAAYENLLKQQGGKQSYPAGWKQSYAVIPRKK